MAIPNLPTDNLYKFLALTGFFMLIGSLGYIHVNKSKISLEEARLKSELEAIEILKKWNVGMDSIASSSLENSLVVDSSNIEAETISHEEYKQHRNELKSKRKQFYDDYINSLLATSEEAIANYEKGARFNHTEQILIIVALVGFAMMLFGFILWYFKLQRHQDIIIKHQAIKALSELVVESKEK